MPSLKTSRQIYSTLNNNPRTIGEWHKNNSDFIMEQTWDNDIQSKVCYIYDYLHDNQKNLNKYMSYENTTKKKIDAKFIITSYGSVDKDQVAYHVMFKPSEKINFSVNDDMYYYETNYKKTFDMIYPTSLYIDIPDENGIYVKWMIIDFEEANQFKKYVVLPCDYKLQWVELLNGKRIKREMWCCTRSANSYTSGLWIDRYFSTPDDINKVLLPLNDITKSFGHIIENNENQRLILSAKTEHPLTWKVSKIENTKPIGIIKVTLKEDVFNKHTDYIEKDEDGNIIGMWADYNTSIIEPVELAPDMVTNNDLITCKISVSSYDIKNSSSYKTLKLNYYDKDNNDISDKYIDIDKNCKFTIDDIDVSDYISIKVDKNTLKIKFNNSDYIGKLLKIECSTDDINSFVELEIL